MNGRDRVRAAFADAVSAHKADRGTMAAAVMGLLTLLVHAVMLPAQALTDDDDFYAPAGLRAKDWFFELLSSPTTALSKTSIDAAFAINHEHPPFAKVVFGAASFVFHDVTGVFGVLDSARMGTVCLVAVLSAVMVRWLWRPMGPSVALAAPVILVSLPRFFTHSEVATLDVPVAVMIFVSVAAFEAARDRVGAGVAVGVVFGLALATKLNAPFALLPCVALVLMERWRGIRAEDADDRSAHARLWLPRVPTALVAMMTIAPVVFLAAWPWLWPDPVTRLGGYFAFHLRHYPIFMFFDGAIYNDPFAPGRAMWVMATGTVPMMVVCCAVIGAIDVVKSAVRIVVGANASGTGSATRDRILVLCGLQAVLSVAVVAVSNVPRYGGEKLFMPFFPFFAVVAAVGVGRVALAIARVARVSARANVAIFVGVVVVVVAPGVAGIANTVGGYGLSYYGELVGGLRGAVARGYERTYYDMADKDLARTLDDVASGRRVHFAPNHKEYVRTYRWLRKDGVIRRDGFILESSADRADVLVLSHERRWQSYPALRDAWRGYAVVAEKRIDGVPLWTVYRRR